MKRRYKLAIYVVGLWAAGTFPVWALIPVPAQIPKDVSGIVEALLLVLFIVGGLIWVLWRPAPANGSNKGPAS